jgi:hypothetical protein
MEKRTGHDSRRHESHARMFKGSRTNGLGKANLISGRHTSIPEDVVQLDLSNFKNWRTGGSRSIAHGKTELISGRHPLIPEDLVQLDLSMLRKWRGGRSRTIGLGKAKPISGRHGSIPEDAAQLELSTLRDYEQQFDFKFPSYQMEMLDYFNDYFLPV